MGIKAGVVKDQAILDFLYRYKIDIAGFTEPNVHWGKVKQENHFHERTKGWFESLRYSLGYNIHRGRGRAKRSQPGGCITLARDDISHRNFESGRDDSGLGRWSWLRFRGKQASVTRVVTAYCPTKSHGPNTVYSQHLEHLGRDAIRAFWDDLAAAVDKWHLEGDRVILMGDWNTDVQSPKMATWLEEHGLINSLNMLHGTNSPPTHNRGSKTIDAIFCSSNLESIHGGYLEFGHFVGDHRGLWIDVLVDDFIGYNPPPIVTAEARRLKMDDPATVERYNVLLDSMLEEEGLYIRLNQLLSEVKDQEFTPAQAKEFETIDHLSSQAMLRAEQKCRKLKMGGVKWSPALQRTRDLILLWTLVRRKLLGRKVGTRRIVRLRKKLKVAKTCVTEEVAKAQLNDAYKQYKAAKQQAESLSIAYRERLAQRKAAAGKTSEAAQIRQMNSIEQQRTSARRIRRTLGKGKGQGTSKIEVEINGRIVEVTQEKEMVKHIAQENEQKFHQISHTPLLHDSIIKDIGLLGDGPRVDDILAGTYEPPPTASSATKRWLRHMKVPSTHKREEIITTLADFREGWKRVKEKTSSGQQHFGHFKSGCLHKKIGWFLYVRSVLPYNRGYSPSRWQQGTDVMILKKEELYLLTKLRTIVLYEADYNHENKRFGRDSMKIALKNGYIAQEQFCRPGRGAQDNALCKRQAFDYARTKKRPFAFGASDLALCYDRIAHNAASIALQRIGMSRRKIRSLFGTVQRLTHRIRTLFGTSAFTFGGDPGKYYRPPQGTGQGNGAAPSIWAILSSTIFEILHEEGFSTSFMFALSLGLFNICGFSYVDDCDLLMTGDTASSLADDFQSMLTVWDELMEVTGAALAPSKCWWYLVDFAWRNGIAHITDPEQEFELRARDKKGDLVTLERLQSHQAKEMVGVHLAPDGNHKEQIKVLRSKSTKWADNIRKSNLSYHETWTALNTTAMKSLEYPLCATTINQQDMTSIVAPILDAGLPRSGFCCNFPRDVLYGPTSLQGVGVKDPYLTQYCQHIRDIITHGWKQTLSGQYLKANIEAIILEAGISGPLFMYTHPITWFNTKNSWVIETWKFCREHDVLFDEGCGTISLKRGKDQILMEAFHSHGYTLSELKQINRCRLYYGVTRLSDITSGDGTTLMEHIITECHLPQSNRYDWPIQQKPTAKDRKLWISAIQACFAPMNNRLTSPLGNWRNNPLDHIKDWEWFTNMDGDLFAGEEILGTTFLRNPSNALPALLILNSLPM